MIKIMLILGLMFVAVGTHAAIPTGVTVAIGRGGNNVQSYELEGKCALLLVNYSVEMTVEAAVPIYRPMAPGDVRLLLLGRVENERQLWVGKDGFREVDTRLPFTNVVSIAPFSDNDAIVAQADGTISIIDYKGDVLKELSIFDRLSADIETKLGSIVRVWRTGPQTLAVVTTQYIIHWDYSKYELAKMIRHGVENPYTANGNDSHIWLAHNADSSTAISFSLFNLSTYALEVTHEIETSTNLMDVRSPAVCPIYHDPQDGTSYFALRTRLIAVTDDSIGWEDWRVPQLQKLMQGVEPSDLLVYSPPTQGIAFSHDQNMNWYPPGFLVHGDLSAEIARRMEKVTGKRERRNVLGALRTKAELTHYLRAQLIAPGGYSEDVESQVVANRFNEAKTPMPPALKQAIESLDSDILGNFGLQHQDGLLVLTVPRNTAKLSRWVQLFWELRLDSF